MSAWWGFWSLYQWFNDDEWWMIFHMSYRRNELSNKQMRKETEERTRKEKFETSLIVWMNIYFAIEIIVTFLRLRITFIYYLTDASSRFPAQEEGQIKLDFVLLMRDICETFVNYFFVRFFFWKINFKKKNDRKCINLLF
jgi:hypothetical protein